MCPHCGKLLPMRQLTQKHDDADTGQPCAGIGQAMRNHQADRRPLWNGKPNPHLNTDDTPKGER